MQRVDIVLATYNGEAFLAELLDSIRNQAYRNWRLLVTDDGSTDGTLSILDLYEKLDSRIKIVNKLRMGGPLQNFGKGLEYVDSDYFMFSDQDDVWDPEKINLLLELARNNEDKFGATKPIGVFSSLKLIDDKGLLLAEDYYRYKNLNPKYNTSYKYLLWKCSAPGCVSIFNKAAYRAAMPLPINISMHDHWCFLVCSLLGKVVFNDAPTINYRQHDSNVIGGQKHSFVHKVVNIRAYLKRTRLAALHSRAYLNSVKQRFGSSIEIPYSCKSFARRIFFVRDNVLPFADQNRLFLIFFVAYFIFLRANESE